MLKAVGEAEELLFDTDQHFFMEVIFPLLEKVLTCNRSNIAYRVDDDSAIVFRSEDKLRQYLCQHGIPHVHRLTSEEHKTLSTWVRYAHVLKSDLSGTHPALTSAQVVRDILLDGLHVVKDEQQQQHYKAANQVFASLPELQAYIRGHGDAVAPRRYRNLSQNQKINLRVWAARCKLPLPQHPSVLLGEEHDDEEEEEEEQVLEQEEEALVPARAAGAINEATASRKRKSSNDEEERPAKKPRSSWWNIFSFGRK